MKFPILIACFLIPSLASGDEAPKSKRLRCGSRAIELPPLDQPRFPRPHSFQEDQPFVPYKILYLIDDKIDQDEVVKLKMATEYVNERLSKTIKARRLIDVRFRNLHPQCIEMCAEMPFPMEFMLICHPTNIPDASDEIKNLNESNYTLVVRVLLRDQGAIANKQLQAIENDCIDDTLAFARSCHMMPIELARGPHHGILVLCDKPSSTTDDRLRALILHETLHIHMPGGLSGIVGGSHSCQSGRDCKDKSWKEVKRQAKNEHGQVVDITIGMAIGPLLQKAAQDHFGCEAVEGVEMNFKIYDRSTMDFEIDYLHWSEHLFPDEVMAPVQSTASHFSNLTLSALANYHNWYKVDHSQAEPLVSSIPSEEFACDVAQKTCFEILKEQTGKGVKLIRPFCDIGEDSNRVITSHCSPDHQRQLTCMNEVSESHCAFLIGTTDHMYDTDLCANATSVKALTLASHTGAAFGPGTICVTTTNFPPWDSHKTNALCLHHECQADTLILKFKPTAIDDPNCYITCAKGDSNQLLTMKWCNKDENEVTIICPDYEQVCKKETTTPATTSTVPKTTSSAPPTTSSTVPPTTTSTVTQITSTTTRPGAAPGSLDPGRSPMTTAEEEKPQTQVTSFPSRPSSSTADQPSISQGSVSTCSL